MALSFNAALAQLICDTYTGRINNGSAQPTPYFVIYKGTVPANVRTAPAGDVAPLASVPMAADAFGDSVVNLGAGYVEATAGTITDTAATADGAASFFRQFDRDGNAIWQGTITGPGGGGDMELSTTNVVTGVNVVVQSYVFRVGI